MYFHHLDLPSVKHLYKFYVYLYSGYESFVCYMYCKFFPHPLFSFFSYLYESFDEQKYFIWT